jgi:hypothetical protein
MRTHKRALDPYKTKCGRIIKGGHNPFFKWHSRWDHVNCKSCLKKKILAVLDNPDNGEKVKE